MDKHQQDEYFNQNQFNQQQYESKTITLENCHQTKINLTSDQVNQNNNKNEDEELTICKKKQFQKKNQDENQKIEIMNIENEERYKKSRLYKKEIDLQTIQNQLKHYGYKILKYINSGGEADIFKVIDENNQQKAIKIVLEDFQNLKNEFNLVQQYQGSIFIIEYYQFIELEQVCIIVMDLCEGNLKDLIQKIITGEIQFDEADLISLLGNLSYGLSQLRSNYLIHSDIKLENILYVNSQDLTFIFSDFGACVQVNGENQKGILRYYTENYMPLEAIEKNEVTFQVDQACFYETFKRILSNLENVVQFQQVFLKIKNIFDELKQKQIACDDIPNFLALKSLKEESFLSKNNIYKVSSRLISIYRNMEYDSNQKKDQNFTNKIKHDLLLTNFLLFLLLKDKNIQFPLSQIQHIYEIDFLKLIEQLKEADKMVGVFLDKLGQSYCLIGQIEKGLKLQFKAFEIAKKLCSEDYHYSLICNLINIGNSYKNDEENLKKYFYEVLKIQNKQPPSEDILNSAYLKDWVTKLHGQVQTIQTQEMMLAINEHESTYDNEYNAYYLQKVGISYNSLGDYSNALIHLQKSLDMRLKLDQSVQNHQIGYLYIVIGSIYQNIGELQLSCHNYYESGQIFKKLSNEDKDFTKINSKIQSKIFELTLMILHQMLQKSDSGAESVSNNTESSQNQII